MPPTEALAYVISAYGQPFELRTVILPPPAQDEVLVKIKATGICHTDIIAATGVIPVKIPAILGHEGVGEVVQAGAASSHLKKGDLVILSFASCAQCRKCSLGHPALCENFLELNLFGTKGVGANSVRCSPLAKSGEPDSGGASSLATKFFGQSSFANYANVNVRSCVKIDQKSLVRPEGPPIPISHLAPFGCGFMTGAGTILNVCKPDIGSNIVIYGAGAVGLAAITAAAHLSPANRIVAVDISATKLAFAAAAGATHCLDSTKLDNEGTVEFQRTIGRQGFDFAVDTTGNVQVIKQMLQDLGPNGCAIQVAGPMSGKGVEIHPSFMVNSAATYKGVIQGDSVPETFLPALVDHYKNGRFPVGHLIKEYYAQDLNKALKDIKEGKVVKAVIIWEDS